MVSFAGLFQAYLVLKYVIFLSSQQFNTIQCFSMCSRMCETYHGSETKRTMAKNMHSSLALWTVEICALISFKNLSNSGTVDLNSFRIRSKTISKWTHEQIQALATWERPSAMSMFSWVLRERTSVCVTARAWAWPSQRAINRYNWIERMNFAFQVVNVFGYVSEIFIVLNNRGRSVKALVSAAKKNKKKWMTILYLQF